MGDPREPPEGAPEGGSGSDDEFRSVVFDESFVRAARIQELSAQERLDGTYRATRPRVGLGPFGTLPRQAVALLLVVFLAFAAAVYFGVSSPHRQAAPPSGNQLTTSLVALSPTGPVAAVADPEHPFAALPAAYGEGTAGLALPLAPPPRTSPGRTSTGRSPWCSATSSRPHWPRRPSSRGRRPRCGPSSRRASRRSTTTA
ncbi:hypothetical protein ACFQ1I_16215 [Kitasatospora arboriphila]